MPQRTLLCFGDSNTHGTRALRFIGDTRRLDPSQRWPGVTAAALGDGWSVIEEGHPGRTTVQDDPIEGIHKSGLRALPMLLETHRPLDLVIVMLGTNDLKQRFSVPPGDIARSIDRLLQDIAGSAAGPDLSAPRILLVAPCPIEEAGILAEMFTGGAEKSRRLGPKLREVAEARGVAFLDAGDFAAVDPVDGIHLTAEAHTALGRAIAAQVAEMEFQAPG